MVQLFHTIIKVVSKEAILLLKSRDFICVSLLKISQTAGGGVSPLLEFLGLQKANFFAKAHSCLNAAQLMSQEFVPTAAPLPLLYR